MRPQKQYFPSFLLLARDGPACRSAHAALQGTHISATSLLNAPRIRTRRNFHIGQQYDRKSLAARVLAITMQNAWPTLVYRDRQDKPIPPTPFTDPHQRKTVYRIRETRSSALNFWSRCFELTAKSTYQLTPPPAGGCISPGGFASIGMN
ncbi:hypothetical protein J7T55_002205 [Diaporthe amygdali]|uniref:uncharacterized protein n=1 Tax=Phomopsis amygdali TaxID=1214568 RepID=UPI0022FEB408|nr:uncharacterized protein J7T55_002205 [Diaporthe amygdali]KAJ0103786.1 hypothetical protein J7T55_002205 [Diaporthe amygdali]